MSTYKWGNQSSTWSIINAASSQVRTLHACFETYFPSHQATKFESKVWILNLFGELQPPGPLGHILKNDFSQQAFFSHENTLTFGWDQELVRDHTKTLQFKRSKFLCKIPNTYLA